MTDPRSVRTRRWARGSARFLLAILLSSVLMLWAWDAIAVELFQLPAIRFKHALALQAALAALTALLFRVARWSLGTCAPSPAR